MSEPTIRAAQSPAEIDAVRSLFRAYGHHLVKMCAICIGDLDQEIASLPGLYTVLLLATVDGKPAGCVALKRLPSQDGEQPCELKRLWVSPAFRGHRLGKRLMEEAVDHATRSGFNALYLDTVAIAMPEANRLYDVMGFERMERYNANPVADLEFFRLRLSPAPARIRS